LLAFSFTGAQGFAEEGSADPVAETHFSRWLDCALDFQRRKRRKGRFCGALKRYTYITIYIYV